MANPIGLALITDEGRHLLAQAVAGGGKVEPKFYRLSKEVYVADQTMTAPSIVNYWREHDIDLYSMINNDTIELLAITEATDAIDSINTISVYLADGTLFAVANPAYEISKLQRQVVKVQLSFKNMGEIINFNYLPHQETEQDLALLNTITVHGNQILKNTMNSKHISTQGLI